MSGVIFIIEHDSFHLFYIVHESADFGLIVRMPTKHHAFFEIFESCKELRNVLFSDVAEYRKIDDGLAPCFFFKTEEGYTRCRSFDAERARANRMEGWEEYNQEDIK